MLNSAKEEEEGRRNGGGGPIAVTVHKPRELEIEKEKKRERERDGDTLAPLKNNEMEGGKGGKGGMGGKARPKWLVWYVGETGSAARKERKRFCGGRMALLAFACLHSCALILVVLAIMIPVTYLVLVPNAINNALAATSSSQSSGLFIPQMNVTGITNSSANFLITMQMPAISFMGGQASLVGPTTMTLGVPGAAFGNGLAQIIIPSDVSFNLNQAVNQNITASFLVTDMPSLANLIGGGLTSTTAYKIQMKSAWTLKWIGITWYKNLGVSTTVDLAQGSTTGGISFSNTSNPIPPYLRTPNLNVDIEGMYSNSSLITLGPGLPQLSITNLSLINTTSSSITVGGTVSMENPITGQMNVTQIGLAIGSAGTKLLGVALTPLSNGGVLELSNQPASIGYASRVMVIPCSVKFTVLQPGISLITSMLSIASQLEGKGQASIMGPLEVVSTDGGHLIGDVTSQMDVALPPGSAAAAITALESQLAPLILGGLF